MKKFLLLVLMFSSAVSACNIDNGHLLSGEDQRPEPDKAQEWRNDSCGCLGIRSMNLAKMLIEENGLLNKTVEEFVGVFGAPNKKKTVTNTVILLYYSNSICDENRRLNVGSDRCWIEFVFENNQLKEIPEYYNVE